MIDLTTILNYKGYLRVDLTDPVWKIAIPSCLALFLALRLYHQSSRRPRTTKLNGPPSRSLLFGVSKELFAAPDLGAVYNNWEKTYGPVYEIPASLGFKTLVLSDPKAIAHLLARDTFTYHQPQFFKILTQQVFGDMLTVMEGEAHRRQRRALSLAFSNSAIRNLTAVFLDSAHKIEAAWDSSLRSSATDSVKIDVQQWMNHASLDSVGIGGFSHDFGCLTGKVSPVMTALDAIGSVKPSFSIMLTFVLGPRLPALMVLLPNERMKAIREVARSVEGVAQGLLDKAKAEQGAAKEGEVDKSILGALIKSEHAASSVHMSIDEIVAQMQLLMIAGYETTAITLTWALIQLCRYAEVQETLRSELRRELAGGEDPTYDQLVNGLPYLDAFTSEVLRMCPAAPEIIRVAKEDDTIPLTQPILTASGELVDSIFVAEGTAVRIPIAGVNTSEALWGADSEKFDPGRWLVSEDQGDSGNGREKEIQGYKHMLTFISGPRMCLGRSFALTEFKALVSVLIRNFSFELPDGPETKMDRHRSIMVRPKVAGEEGPRVPLIVRRVD